MADEFVTRSEPRWDSCLTRLSEEADVGSRAASSASRVKRLLSSWHEKSSRRFMLLKFIESPSNSWGLFSGHERSHKSQRVQYRVHTMSDSLCLLCLFVARNQELRSGRRIQDAASNLIHCRFCYWLLWNSARVCRLGRYHAHVHQRHEPRQA